MNAPRNTADATAALVCAVSVDPARRDRELVLGDALRDLHSSAEIGFGDIGDAETRRRVGYLVDVAQHLRGQTCEEAERLDEVRRALPPRPSRSFWPGERSLPAGTDPIAERWGFARGVDPLRLRAAMTRRFDLLPPGSDAREVTDHASQA